MKKFALASALIVSTACTAAFASDIQKDIVDLPAQTLHYGALPTALNQVIPVMPASVCGIDGTVLLKFDISENGRVSNIEVVNSTDEKLAKFSKAMVRRWEFSNTGSTVSVQQPVVFDGENEFPTLLALN